MKSLSSLKHTKYSLPSGGKVILLDPGAIIDAEAEAMLQSLHSRSAKGVEEHLLILEERGAEKFMESFYVGYGHKSIGDCGSVTIFIEGVSMLVAKAIQDNQLYSGQEASTRYIDFAEQKFCDPVETLLSGEILEAWRTFYVNSKEELLAHLRAQFPRKEAESEATYEKAIAARSFDILRGFLPAGATTNLAWHTNLRQAADNLCWLRNHPLQEVRDVAVGIQTVLVERYPSSFSHKTYLASEKYYAEMMRDYKYFDCDGIADNGDCSFTDSIDVSLLSRYYALMSTRPAKTDLPKILGECGTIQSSFLLDFGSFRDIQRHRAVIQQMPLLGTQYGFENWYLNELPDVLREKALKLLGQQEQQLFLLSRGAFGTTEETLRYTQYYVAMGYRTPNRVTGGLPALVYLVELRATRFVHPTLRLRAKQMAEFLQNTFGKYGLVLHLDQDPDRFDIKRGEHDIQLKEKAA